MDDPAIRFEGRTFSGPEDVLALLRRRDSLRPRDEHPWEWATRLAEAHPGSQPWLEAALGTLLAEVLGSGPGLDPEAAEILVQARLCGSHGLVVPLLERLHAPLDDWPPAQVRGLLDALLGLEMRRGPAGSALGPADRARVVALGQLDGCLDVALSILGDHAALCADLACAAIARGAIERGPDPDRTLSALARRYGRPDFRRFRGRVVDAFAGASAALRAVVARWGPRRPGRQRNALLADLYPRGLLPTDDPT